MTDNIEVFDIFAALATYRKAMTVMDVANLVGISKQTVYEHIYSGSLPALKLGTITKLNPRDVGIWIQSRMTVQPKLRKAA